jgi:hypothetical protein
MSWSNAQAMRAVYASCFAAYLAGCGADATISPRGEGGSGGATGQGGSSSTTGRGGATTISSTSGSGGAGTGGVTSGGGAGGVTSTTAGSGGASSTTTGVGGADAGLIDEGSAGSGGSIADAAASDAAADTRSSDGGSVVIGAKTSLIWVWLAYKTSLDSIIAHPKSFTHVSPALYQVNYAYTSGVTKLVNANDNYDGLSSSQMVQELHAAGLKIVPLMYGGAGNFGTDQGIQNILNDSPAGTQNNFITAMVGEAVSKKYDGYNLDWEVQGTGYAKYGAKLISFLTAFKAALHQHDMILTIDLAGWYIHQCSGSGGDGLIDVAEMGHNVDLAILEDYSGQLGNASGMCPATPAKQTNCDADFVTQFTVMCALPREVASIGLISTGSNAIAPSALDAVAHYGFTNVAVWPDDAEFLNAKGIPQGGSWYTVLADFMSK